MPYCASCGKELPPESAFCLHCGVPVASIAPPITRPRFSSASGNYADLGQRVVAAIIDSILVGVVVGILVGLFMFANVGMMVPRFGLYGMMPWMWSSWLWFPAALIPLAYYVYFEGTSGQTLGKKTMNIKVVKSNGSPCDFGSALIRNILRFIDNLVIGLVAIILISSSERRQRLGDLAANTIVVKI